MTKTIRFICCIAIAFLVFFSAGCSRPQGQEKPSNQVTVTENASVPADNGSAALETNVLFTINGEPVHTAELRIFMQGVAPEKAGDAAAALPGRVDTFINNRLIAAKAVKEGLDKDPAVRSRMEVRGNQLWRDPYWNRVVLPAVRIDEKALRAKIPPMEEQISLQQIVANTEAEAERFRGRVVSGEDFGKIAQENSVGLTARNEGKVGFVRRDTTMYDRAVTDVLFRMKVGEVSPVLHTELGDSVFKVLERRTADQFRKEWLDQNRKRLVGELEQEAWDKDMDRLFRKKKVVVNRKVIDAYMAARKKSAPLDTFLQKTAFTIDGVSFLLGDLIDPSGTGVIHGEGTLEIIVNKRAGEFVVAREVERLGLREHFPEIRSRERLIREDILAREYVRHRTRDLKVTKEELRGEYEARKERLVVPRSFDVSLIETKSKARLEEIFAMLKSGAPFDEVAEKWSDNRKLKGGRLGFVEEDRIAPEFADVRKLKVGEYSKTPIRLHAEKENVDLYFVARLNAVREKKPISFKEADKDSLGKAVMARKREVVVESILGELRKENVVTFAPAYSRFVESYGKMPIPGGVGK